MSNVDSYRLLSALSAIPNRSCKAYNCEGVDLFVIRWGESVYAYRNRCPHLGLPLNWLPDQFLDIDGELIQCSSHGALFTIEQGRCVAGPCAGQSLQALDCAVIQQNIFVRLEEH